MMLLLVESTFKYLYYKVPVIKTNTSTHVCLKGVVHVLRLENYQE